MELADIARSLGTLLVVLGLLVAVVWSIRRFGLLSGLSQGRDGRPLSVSVVLRVPIDPKHSLVMVRRGIYEHLLLIGPNGSLLVEQNILAGEIK